MVYKDWDSLTEEEKFEFINPVLDLIKNFLLKNDIIDFTVSHYSDDEQPEIKGGIGNKLHSRYVGIDVIEVRVSKFKEAKINKFKNT